MLPVLISCKIFVNEKMVTIFLCDLTVFNQFLFTRLIILYKQTKKQILDKFNFSVAELHSEHISYILWCGITSIEDRKVTII